MKLEMKVEKRERKELEKDVEESKGYRRCRI